MSAVHSVERNVVRRLVCCAARRAARALGLLVLFACTAPPLRAQDAGATYLIVIAGVSGEPRIGTEWHGMAMAIATAATQRFGIPPARVIVLEQDSTLGAGTTLMLRLPRPNLAVSPPTMPLATPLTVATRAEQPDRRARITL